MSSAQCSAISNALKAKGLSNVQLAAQVGTNVQRIDNILTGKEKPTTQEFNSIAAALGLSSANAPGHAAQVAV